MVFFDSGHTHVCTGLYDNRTALIERKVMYLTTLDTLVVIFALVVSVTLVITTALANARLTRSVEEYRKAYFNLKAGK